MSIAEEDAKPGVKLGHRHLSLGVRPGSSAQKRAEVIHDWHKTLLHAVVPGLIRKWEGKLGVRVSGYFLQRMKTKWGSCNTLAGRIWLNLELVKKPPECLEFIVVHELIHLLERRHNERFMTLIDLHLPNWREHREKLNKMPLAFNRWGY